MTLFQAVLAIKLNTVSEMFTVIKIIFDLEFQFIEVFK